MKISEIVPGQEYAVDDSGRYNYYSTPRQVKVVEIVTEAKQEYSQWTANVKTKNVRRVKIKFLDSPSIKHSRWGYEVRSAKKNTTMVVDARKIVAKWEDIRDDIMAKIEDERAETELQESLEKRLRKLGLRDSRVYISDVDRPEIDIMRKDVEKILKLAEKGAGLA